MDYAIIKVGNTNALCHIVSRDNKKLNVVLEKNRHIPGLQTNLVIHQKDLVLELGKNPPRGNAYGVDTTSLYKGRKNHDFFGDINFFYKPEKQVVKNLWKAFSIAEKKLKNFNLDQDLVIEVLPKFKQKYAGIYMHSRKEKMPNRIQIIPEVMDASDYPYVILHEFAHSLHYRHLMDTDLDADWISLYNTSIKVKTVKKEQCLELLEMVKGSDESIGNVLRTVEDDELRLAGRWILREISKIHGLSIKELSKLQRADKMEEVLEVWPKHALRAKDLEPVISEYATKNYKETVAESLSFHWIGKKLPKSVDKLIDKTLPLFE